MGKLIILGLDGATFTLLDPLLSAGRLPELSRLQHDGVHGHLRSTVHPITPAAWTSAMTGLNPGKHGVYDFVRRRASSYGLEIINARWRDGEPLWSILGNQGRRVGVFNVPMTYPPDPVKGFMVSGMDAPGVWSEFVQPGTLRADLLAAVPDYRIDLDEATTDEDALLERIEALAAIHERGLDALLQRHPDLDALIAVFVATDRLYHNFWHYLDPASPSYSSERAAYVRALHERIVRRADAYLGKLRAWAGEDATIIVLSDHGFGPLEKDVYLNRFLLDAGLLHFRASSADLPFDQAVDWDKTKAYSFGFFGNLNLNLRGREPQGCVEQGREAEELKKQMTAALMALCDPETGEKLVDAVYRREDLYSGPHVDDAPDLLVVMHDYAYMTRSSYEGAHDRLVAPPMTQNKQRLPHSGNHRLDGILLMAGPGIRRGTEISGASLLDIAPTALYALGQPVPSIMDGHVLRQAFSEQQLAQRPPRRLLMPLPAVESPAQRRLTTLIRQISSLEARNQELEQADATYVEYARRVEAAHTQTESYARQLEAALEEKNSHIIRLEAAIHERDEMIAAYQHSLAYRLLRLWRRFAGR